MKSVDSRDWPVHDPFTNKGFTHNVVVDPSDNALGPFTIGQTVKLRTCVTNTNGTTARSVRTLMIQSP